MKRFLKTSASGYFLSILTLALVNLLFIAFGVDLGLTAFVMAIVVVSVGWIIVSLDGHRVTTISNDKDVVNIEIDYTSSVEGVEDINILSAEIMADGTVHVSLEVV